MKNEYLLPRKAVIDNVFALLDEVRNRPNYREEEMRKWVRELDRSKHALVQWGLVDDSSGRLTLTKSGEAVAWSNDRERDDLLLQHVVLGYEPYTVVVAHQLKDWSNTLTTDEVLPIWARNLGITLGRGEMSASSATMFGLMERAGLGRYIIGRGGKQTRIEFNSDAEERIRAAQELGKKPDPTTPMEDGEEDGGEAVSEMKSEPRVTPVPEGPPDEDARAAALRQARFAEQRRRNAIVHGATKAYDDADAGFEVYRRPGLEIKVRPTTENIKRGIRFLKMLELEADASDDTESTQRMAT